jgi:uncharacterized protein (DUF58 family)
MNELLKKLRKYEIQIRKVVQNRMHGDFHSIFKGSGLEYEDVRAYQYGDDVRAIDWNVTAKGHGTYIKTFKEEKEQQVLFIVDVSASQNIGKNGSTKADKVKEICGVLTLSAVKEAANVGLICYSDQKELFIEPKKGALHGYQMILNLFKLQPQSIKTNLNQALKFTLGFLKKKTMVILVSDFIDADYERNLMALAQKHELVVIHISDAREINFPKFGIIPMFDKESKRTIWINSSSSKFQEKVSLSFKRNQEKLEEICRKYQASYIDIDTSDDYVLKLIKLFRLKRLYH